MVAGESLKDPIRSHYDLDKDNCKYFKKACKVQGALLYCVCVCVCVLCVCVCVCVLCVCVCVCDNGDPRPVFC